MKTNIKKLAAELNLTVEELLAISSAKLTAGVTGVGKNTWFEAEAVEAIKLAVEVPALMPSKLVGKVKRFARNPSWVYVKIDGVDPVVPVAVPRRLRDRMLGKVIPIEAISDGSGETTYRYDYGTR